ncbi:hypothetical protein K7H77_002237 [Salmonella enterica]|uniref:Eae-like protein n=1 Tax=Salmonella newport TaxID=108619 RepID=A0A628M7Y4_SALNE|nr:hypothetical protein [Salmonella enterica]ECT9541056.1 hypothetical protein [Salmonella enterica subsp. enterica serovar Newport]EBT4410094.1 hypothetical protein [Salmonella enterica]ECP1160768.1 hypothetical protein [Salmonella enterica]ECX2313107.1 hypothetical protein [Salmonella enterica subsp. enterica serovar Newport]
MKQMTLIEMDGFLKGKCIPRDLKVNETNAEYLVRKFAEAEAKCAALAAENAKLKKFCKDAAFDADYEAELGMERGGFSDALNEIKTPATDAFLAEVRAQGVERYAAQLKSEAELADEAGWDGAAKFLISESEKVLAFAAQIRQEAAK